MSADSTRYLPGGEEAGSGPGDRPFRPDVEGLRAVAILLVVLFHTGFPLMRSGYVGVDVFFVVSGFVITGLLLRERETSGGTAYLSFYARRARRILPAALVVIVVSLVATALLFGHRASELVASDSRWTALFLGNFRFGSVFENVLIIHRESPLTNLWSLAVEEQFYLVYPAALALAALAGRRWSFRAVLAIGLTVVVVASFVDSVHLTQLGIYKAYYSPLCRAWELALGGLVALATPWLRRVPNGVATLATWCGLAAVVLSGMLISTTTPYPDWWRQHRWWPRPWLSLAGRPDRWPVPRRCWDWPPSGGSDGGPTRGTCGTGRSWSSTPSGITPAWWTCRWPPTSSWSVRRCSWPWPATHGSRTRCGTRPGCWAARPPALARRPCWWRRVWP